MARGKNILRCPKCGFTFDVTYGRSFACAGCSSIVHCDMAKCPSCGHEFLIRETKGLFSEIR